MKNLFLANLIFLMPAFSSANEQVNTDTDNCEISQEILDAAEEYSDCPTCLFPDEWLSAQGDEEEIVVLASNGKIKLSAKKITGRGQRPVPGKVISTLGDKRSGGRRHEGVDIESPNGTPIKALWKGTVVKVGTNRLGGHVVKIKHPNGLTTYYAHMRGRGIVREGQLVSQGQTLGYVGESGNATTPHLHLEVRSNGRVLNPLNYI